MFQLATNINLVTLLNFSSTCSTGSFDIGNLSLQFSAGNNFSSLTGHVSFQIFILVGHLINLTGH